MTSTSKTARSPGWGVVLTGHIADLTAWERALATPFDPWIERTSQGEAETFVLRSRGFDALVTANEVRAMARPLVERLDGALKLVSSEEPVRAGPVLQFRPDGGIDTTLIVDVEGLRLRGITGQATAVVLGDDGKPLPAAPPQPSACQNWAAAAEANDDIADLLVHYGRSDGDWFELYKTLEVAERIGKRHGGYQRLLGMQAKSVKEMRITANFYRHARAATYRPAVLVAQTDAKPLLRWVVRTILTAAVP